MEIFFNKYIMFKYFLTKSIMYSYLMIILLKFMQWYKKRMKLRTIVWIFKHYLDYHAFLTSLNTIFLSTTDFWNVLIILSEEFPQCKIRSASLPLPNFLGWDYISRLLAYLEIYKVYSAWPTATQKRKVLVWFSVVSILPGSAKFSTNDP